MVKELKTNQLKIAITHDYLLEYGGAELVLLELLRLFPQADLYTAFYKPTKKQREFWFEVQKHKIITSRLNKLPFIKRFFKFFMPATIRFFTHQDLSKYDLVISSSANFAKWLNLKGTKTKHIAYIHIPPRFLWGWETSFYYKIPAIVKFLFKGQLNNWKELDKQYAKKADLLITNSEFIAKKINAVYGKKAILINPPVAIETILNKPDQKREDFFLTIGRLYQYKRTDLLVKALTETEDKLVIIGDGPERKSLEKIAGPNIEFRGFIDENEKIRLLKTCKAFIFAAEEDFGIVMVEALAAGAPVITYAKGGALEIVNDKEDGVLYKEQTPEAIISALDKFKGMKFSHTSIKSHANRYSREQFRSKLLSQVDLVVL